MRSGSVWLPITTDAGNGWVARDFIVADPGAGGAPNLRRLPGLAAEVIAVMVDRTSPTVEDGSVVGDGHTWYEVTGDAYGTGWAVGEFLAAD